MQILRIRFANLFIILFLLIAWYSECLLLYLQMFINVIVNIILNIQLNNCQYGYK